MDAGAQPTCKGSGCDARPKNTPTDDAAEGILLDCCCDAGGHGMPPNARNQPRAKPVGCTPKLDSIRD
jgi:hypothetical protein